jgi:uncharacterized protein YggE
VTRKIALLMIITALVFSWMPLAASVRAQNQPQDMTQDTAQRRTLTVTGTGQASGSPDVAFVELGTEVRNEDVGAAVNTANTSMQAVTTALQSAGIAPDDIQTTQFSVRQETPPSPTGGTASAAQTFVVTNTVRIKVRDIGQISDVIQAGLDAGANRVFGLNFGLEDPATLQTEARQRAVDDAQARAEELAAAFGMTLGQPVQINEGGAGGPSPVAQMAAVGGAGGVPISQGQLSVTVQITVTYELLPQ